MSMYVTKTLETNIAPTPRKRIRLRRWFFGLDTLYIPWYVKSPSGEEKKRPLHPSRTNCGRYIERRNYVHNKPPFFVGDAADESDERERGDEDSSDIFVNEGAEDCEWKGGAKQFGEVRGKVGVIWRGLTWMIQLFGERINQSKEKRHTPQSDALPSTMLK